MRCVQVNTIFSLTFATSLAEKVSWCIQENCTSLLYDVYGITECQCPVNKARAFKRI